MSTPQGLESKYAEFQKTREQLQNIAFGDFQSMSRETLNRFFPNDLHLAILFDQVKALTQQPQQQQALVAQQQQQQQQVSKKRKYDEFIHNFTPIDPTSLNPTPKRICQVPSHKFISLDPLLNDEITLQFFPREATKTLFQELDGAKTRWVVVEGSPGIGKTFSTWLYALSKLNEIPKILYLKCLQSSKKLNLAILEKEKATYYQYMDIPDITNMDLERFQLVIFDGIVSTNDEACFDLMRDLNPKKVIFVSSQGALLSFKDYKIEGGATRFFFPPWTLDEYIEACKTTSISNTISSNNTDNNNSQSTPLLFNIIKSLDSSLSDTVEDACKEKFFYAGHSARFFFGFSIEQTQEKFQNFLEINSGSSNIGLGADLKVMNTMFTMIKSEKGRIVQIPTSEYLGRITWKACHAQQGRDLLFKSLEFKENGAFQGWLLELQYLKMLSMSTQGPYHLRIPKREFFVHDPTKSKQENEENNNKIDSTNPKTGEWKAENLLNFDKEKEIPTISPSNRSFWLQPKKFNQGTYDFAHASLSEDDKVVTLTLFQVTTSTTHSLKTTPIITLINALAGRDLKEVMTNVKNGVVGSLTFHLSIVVLTNGQRFSHFTDGLGCFQNFPVTIHTAFL